MPRILNKRTAQHEALGAIYIGRPSKWGNPFVIGRDGDRAEVIRKYEEYLLNHPRLLSQIGELRGSDLMCWCSPEACHGDVLLHYANVGEK